MKLDVNVTTTPSGIIVPKERIAMKVREDVAYAMPGADKVKVFQAPKVAPGVLPAKTKLAIDSAVDDTYNNYANSAISEGLGFVGYPYLAELTQRAEYRRPAEILAKEMTRKWMRLTSISSEETSKEKIDQINEEFDRLNVRLLFQKAQEHDGFFGRGQLYLDTGVTDNPAELKMPLKATIAKVGKNALKEIILVDPTWTYPNYYNANDPLKPDYFKPSSWFIMGKEVHASRLMFFVSRPVPDLLKPTYAFGGLSLSQMMKPYVDNWLRTRQSVSDIIHSFSTQVLKTNMSGILNGGAATDFFARLELFNRARDNKGIMAIDKELEDFVNVSVPLGSLDHLQAQSQEHMSAVVGIPLVKLLGITPSGLNASSEGETRSFYDWIHSQQEVDFSPNLKRLLDIVQLSLFGEVDPSIKFTWEPLWDLDQAAIADMRKAESASDVEYINAGVLSPLEVRNRLAAESDGAYNGLDVDELPEIPEMGGGEEDKAAK